MMKISQTLIIGLLFMAGSAVADDAIKVTPDNFVRAESDMYFAVSAKEGGLGKLFHRRDTFDVDHQAVVRGNRDTLYSSGVFDLDAGPVTITMPDSGNRFMSLMILNEDHYVIDVFHGAGSHTLTKDRVGTRYVLAAIRTLIDPGKTGDADEVHKLQDAIKVGQPGGPGKLELPTWDKVSQDKVRSALLALNATMGSFDRAFGSKEQVDPVHHLIGAAAGWGGNPDSEAMYIAVTPPQNDGKTVYTLRVPPGVPVDGFWSISRYNSEGFFVPNSQNAYSVNNLTATKGSDGSIEVQFGGCDGKVANCLPIEAGWNYTVRLYRPQPQVLDGSWKFPDPQPR
ncbi:DUF1254 domain-containing protein [Rhizobium cauense]|uniref:DUF1214 domain-containing protein n=1 Tax=Rhizobium cauense TaxID=1166683 RepID=UPI001C6F583B|nr:DUF1214 domain-containing protein [Rhizobium cauense]MBW9115912.1 DUF1254 domain-containing protein [Rhizobium cauense]